MAVSDFFTIEQKNKITNAIKEAELNTSGEIRVHIEKDCKIEVLDRAAEVFSKLQMHKTDLRNGVLFYAALADRKFAILGDAGINSKVPDGFWNEVNLTVINEFKSENYADGLSRGIILAGQQLKKHFPYKSGDINELADDISFGK
jgi:uncharacterized membrane protein